MTMASPLRCGLAGTGHWAQITHAPALASTDGIEFAAVWGRNADATSALAAAHGATAHRDLGAFLADIDAVVFSVPPDVQSEIAVRAAGQGKHLLLEKPVAVSDNAADALVGAIADAGVASIVFFTDRFEPGTRAWLAEAASAGPWSGGSATWLGSAMQESSPFNTPWRRQKGGLWDLGPHVVSMLWASLGPVISVSADGGFADVTHLVLHHEGGVSSTATVTLSAPPAAEFVNLYLWGASGRAVAPIAERDAVAALRVALTELAANVRNGQVDHPCDVRFGAAVVRVLAEAERQLSARAAG